MSKDRKHRFPVGALEFEISFEGRNGPDKLQGFGNLDGGFNLRRKSDGADLGVVNSRLAAEQYLARKNAAARI